MFGRQQLQIKRTGVTTTVPNNDVARCMYYLKCVCTTVECDDANILRFTNYNNYWALSDDEDEIVFKLCLALSPDVLDDKVFFHSDALCGDSNNEFYEFSQVRHVITAVRSIVIAGRTRQVNKIMTYTLSWLQNNYLGPMRRLADRFNPERRLIRAMAEADCIIS
ncbi:unnamed protein product [Rotaria socialis]|uniref:Uncharacterized protein n=1 Tax=Rotaria socialis TaxID=392032 RepID=A0A817Y6N7_9BILA|nr:unnamed protein product [Rotaria socialis]CAF3376659.1 unnamed protein product [Rotaria socialis]CAF3467431.1 unnamed protein product [Rotaria socialis]CAF3639963.1 unnamed protein product [Rotaria socialis]CAF3717914.1 unnamed protein product [Rotaria socialis]